MHIDFYSVSCIGLKRPVNQDSVFAESFDDRIGLFVIADGMGGHYMGELASQHITEEISIWWQEQLDSDFCKGFDECRCELLRILRDANDHIFDNYTAKGKICGSTVVVMFIYEKKYFLVNVGDSRLYMYEDNCLKKLNFDHTYGEVAVKNGTITKEEAVNSPKREKLVEAIGCKKEFNEYQFCDAIGYTRYLLCSDGLYKMLPLSKLNAEVGKMKSPVQKICRNLIKKVYSAGAKDNVSCILIDISDGKSEPFIDVDLILWVIILVIMTFLLFYLFLGGK